jgi:hypothetical protein
MAKTKRQHAIFDGQFYWRSFSWTKAQFAEKLDLKRKKGWLLNNVRHHNNGNVQVDMKTQDTTEAATEDSNA